MTGCDLTLEALAAWWQGEDTGDVEAHLFDCDRCARRLAWIAALADAYPAAIERGRVRDVALTASMVERLAAAGVVMREYRPGPNQDIACTVAMEDDLSVSWIPARPAPGERIDLVMTAPDGSILRAAEDAPVDPATGCVIYARASETLRPLPAIDLRLRVLAVGPSGTRTIGEHVYHHTPMKR